MITPLVTPCIEWAGRRSPKGYGIAWDKAGQRDIRAHRLEWEKHHGPIPLGMLVCHKCDNPPCYNIDHLFLGTTQDNTRDRDAKGRGRTSWIPGRPPLTAKITAAIASEIRHRFRAGGRAVDIASEFGISRRSVHNIVRRDSWKEAA